MGEGVYRFSRGRLEEFLEKIWEWVSRPLPLPSQSSATPSLLVCRVCCNKGALGNALLTGWSLVVWVTDWRVIKCQREGGIIYLFYLSWCSFPLCLPLYLPLTARQSRAWGFPLFVRGLAWFNKQSIAWLFVSSPLYIHLMQLQPRAKGFLFSFVRGQ